MIKHCLIKKAFEINLFPCYIVVIKIVIVRILFAKRRNKCINAITYKKKTTKYVNTRVIFDY